MSSVSEIYDTRRAIFSRLFLSASTTVSLGRPLPTHASRSSQESDYFLLIVTDFAEVLLLVFGSGVELVTVAVLVTVPLARLAVWPMILKLMLWPAANVPIVHVRVLLLLAQPPVSDR